MAAAALLTAANCLLPGRLHRVRVRVRQPINHPPAPPPTHDHAPCPSPRRRSLYYFMILFPLGTRGPVARKHSHREPDSLGTGAPPRWKQPTITRLRTGSGRATCHCRRRRMYGIKERKMARRLGVGGFAGCLPQASLPGASAWVGRPKRGMEAKPGASHRRQATPDARRCRETGGPGAQAGRGLARPVVVEAPPDGVVALPATGA
ncbi:uncharacterized protein K452DRAFT_344723 [Aplosporella prunicola CBS 121167]|uniref:Uncharacterized protein n=1 Tax=Aplosporella prunicola CBS 121167 TaxID=1176127 RepID=A0A6A6BKT9_9PEZI|nr:uncharacterized protein K452DRAFT_344723 [Aplosporella prunicola CBS 121167]KAF2144656.1 hypothetical protein K452DRAFT_344723 [Aplosporella prunicola CBS 121167]